MGESKNEMEAICEWAYDSLQSAGSVTKDQFLQHYPKIDPSIWNRAIHAIHAIMLKGGADIELDGAGLVLKKMEGYHDSTLSRYTTESFRPDRESDAKQRIGALVASFLKEPLLKGKTIFLGSGSTILHLGLKMCEGGYHYDQRFVTVNIPLAAVWCEKKDPPVSKINIPEAVLDTHTFRFSTMPGPGWPLTVSIVGADGCFYDEDKEEVVLYGNEESVATNTTLFVQNTRHSVILCLTSAKIRMGFAQNPNTGPPISPPKKGVIRVLVTDQRYQNSVKAFEKDGWMIVTESAEWGPVLKKMEEGERTEVRLD